MFAATLADSGPIVLSLAPCCKRHDQKRAANRL
jgi:hypothetical protein